MTRTEYLLYISSEAWLQRRGIFLRAHPTCNRCEITDDQAVESYDQRLHVHHRNYQRVGCELDSDLESLCRRCHQIETFGSSNLAPRMSPEDRTRLRGLIGPDDISAMHQTDHGLEGLFQ